jgi:leucyl aminopeptidase
MKNSVRLTIEISDRMAQPLRDEATALCVFENERETQTPNESLTRFAGAVFEAGEFKGEDGTSLLIYTQAEGKGARRLLLVGLGAREDFNHSVLSRAAGLAAREARSARIRQLSFILPEAENQREAAAAVAYGATQGLYDNDFYQHREEEQPELQRLTIICETADAEIRESVERAGLVAESVNWTRELSDEPGATLPPRELARRAAEMAEEFGLKVESLDAVEIQERGLGALWGVGKGSDNEPALIVIRYEPEEVYEPDGLWAFVGKGITFDTGGINIKHGLDMYEMKADMAGGAAVLGAMRAIAQLKPKRRVVGLVPSAENMPSGRSIKPGDVVKTLAGYNVEVIDTDAEGRLVLIDGIAYARQLGATRIVDLATLTGSIIVALGNQRTGLFSNNDEWAALVLAASERAGEPAWRMPVSDDYKKRIESDVADFKNYGGRPDATAAALLLSKFANDTPWVHLDIAGTAWYDDPQPHAPRGSTGTGVRTLVELVCH